MLRLAAPVVLGCSLLVMGCARTVVVDTNETDYNPNDVTAQLDFWHELPGRSAVTNNEGLHGVILFLEGQDSTGSYEERVAWFDERGWLTAGFDEDPNVAMQRGTLAKVLAHALEIDGGVMMRLTGKSPRYATRELVFLDILPEGTELMVIDGLDYLGVISSAEEYQNLQAARNLRREAPVDPNIQEAEPEAQPEAQPEA